jgi:hypothetical protein
MFGWVVFDISELGASVAFICEGCRFDRFAAMVDLRRQLNRLSMPKRLTITGSGVVTV